MSKLSISPITLDGKSLQEKREEIRVYFHNTFSLFEKVFELLKDESAFYQKSEPTRHPMIFYFGHTATFFINKLVAMKIIDERVNPLFESLFAVGVDEMHWDDLDEKNYQWPSVAEVRLYRERVRVLVDTLIDTLEFTLPIREDSPMWVVLMGIEHERIHIETSLVLHRQMPLEYIKECESFTLCREYTSAPKNVMVEIPQADITLGKRDGDNLYGWDNEYGEYKESVADFEVSKYLVSNAEYMEFLNAGGYEERKFWSEEGWSFVESRELKHPPFWIKNSDGSFHYRALSEIIEMPYSWPVDVNALEAEAFCRYKSIKENREYRLPSEAEYRALYEYAEIEDIPDLAQANLNLGYASSCPVDKFAFKGIYDLVGNVWQWSRTPIFGFDGFAVHEAYDDFSTPTFDGKHALILGSSWASSGNLIMKHSRYAFRRHFYQNAGFRYLISKSTTTQTDREYESDALVSQYCDFQYGDSYFGVKNFAKESARIASKFAINHTKALDLGCATGRASFELAHSFDKVEGVDFSVRFIQAAQRLKESGRLNFSSIEEGELKSQKSVSTQELGFEDIKHKVLFWQGDACNLKPTLKGYDLIMASNLIDRLYNPRLFLDTIDSRLNRDGLLILSSPYTWQEASTKREFWLGGYRDERGEEVKSIESLESILGEKFELLHLEDLEFVIKESARKFQHTISQVSVWRKK